MQIRLATAIPCLTVAFCLALVAVSVSAQTTDATLEGQVADVQGKVVPEVEVDAVNIDTNVKYPTKTNGSGIYVIPDLPPGNYRMVVRKDGFHEINKTDIVLHVQDRVEQNFTLQIGSVNESITVTADQNNIDTTDASVSTTIDRNFAENLPLNGRSFQTLILLSPGVVLDGTGANGGTFSVNGQREDTNYFTVDGVSANLGGFLSSTSSGAGLNTLNGANPDFTIAGTTQGMISVDALQEFKIQTSTYAPEFGRQPGGQVSLLTRSGTNDFHGTAFDYVRNDIFDANNWFNDHAAPQLPKGKERQNDFGGTFGGPLWKDHTFVFFSYEGLRLLQPHTQLFTIPSTELRDEAAPSLQPILNSFPIPNGTDFGNGGAEFTLNASTPTNFDSYSLRVDQLLKKRVHIFGRYSNTSSNSAIFSPGLAQETKLKSNALMLGGDMEISPSLNNEVRASYTLDHSASAYSLSSIGGGVPYSPSLLFPAPFSQASDLASLQINLPTVFAFTAIGPDLVYQRQINVLDNFSLLVRKHQLKWGLDYRRLFPIYRPAPAVANYNITSESDLAAGTISITFPEAFASPHPIYNNVSLYAQDTWKISNRFTLTYGLRWELNPPPGERNGLDRYFLNVIGLNDPATATLAPPGAPVYKTTYDNFAPRLGAAYQLGQTSGRETVVRAGLGVFYDLNSATIAAGYANGAFGNFSSVADLSFPVGPGELTIPPLPRQIIPPFFFVSGIDPNLQLPYTLEWNVALEQALGRDQTVTASYVASAGYRLLQQAVLVNVNPTFENVEALRNASSSNYESLQLQFNRRLSHGLQALASYTYGHSIDNASDEQSIVSSTSSGSGFPNPDLNRGNSNFDVRHTFRGAAIYSIPTWKANLVSRAILGGWSIDTIGLAQSGLPVDLVAGFALNGWATVRPDIVPGQPFYVANSAAPGGLQFNPAAFSGLVGDGLTPPGTIPVDVNGFATRQGTLGRNVLRGLGAWQIDFAIHRQFNFTERVNLQFRSEFFNLFNHPNFGGIDNFLGDGTFGQAVNTLNNYYGGLNSLYQIGGPRSIQFALKLTL
jgi:hypothetical protein